MNKHSLDKLLAVVVVDSENMRALLGQMLHGIGLRKIRYFNDPAEALDALTEISADFIIAKLSMEPMSGLEFVRRLRRADNLHVGTIPVIMVTTQAGVQEIMAARDVGINEFLAAPIAPQALHDRIVALIEQPRPFIKAESYVGPDRRRRKGSYTGQERRSGGKSTAKATAATEV